jgi:hypothetical protein
MTVAICTVLLVNWTEFLATSLVAFVLAGMQIWVARGRRPGRLRREAVEAAQLAVALDTLRASSSLRDQARAESMAAARRALSTAKPSWVPSAIGFVSILLMAGASTEVLPNATARLWSVSMLVVGLAIAVLAWGVEAACRWIGRRFIRVPNTPSALTAP